VVAYVGALVLALQLAGIRGVTDEPAQAEPAEVAPAATPPPPRPQSVPTRIPEWAWATSRWHDQRQAGLRPEDAPQVLPRWYWEWRAWRKESGA
jgi:hypothetical protein